MISAHSEVLHNSLHNSGLPAQPLACKLLILNIRRDVRVVEGARLESVCRGNSTEGSNPSLSATNKRFRVKNLQGQVILRLELTRWALSLRDQPLLDAIESRSTFRGVLRHCPSAEAVGKRNVLRTSVAFYLLVQCCSECSISRSASA